MKSLRLAVWMLALTCTGLAGCAPSLKSLACTSPPYVWDPTSEVCHDAFNKEAPAGCCDKEPTGR